MYSDRWLPRVASSDSTSKPFNLALCFSLRRLVQVVSVHFNYHHFFFFRLNYHSDFYSSLKSLYVHQMIENHLIDDWNFLTCLPVYSYMSTSSIISSYCQALNMLHVNRVLLSIICNIFKDLSHLSYLFSYCFILRSLSLIFFNNLFIRSLSHLN